MWCGKAILLLLVLAFTAKDVSAGCTVVDRFIGVDSGDFVGMSFKYDLTVKSGTTQADIRTNILPAIEKALAEKIAPSLSPPAQQVERTPPSIRTLLAWIWIQKIQLQAPAPPMWPIATPSTAR
ncbi:hypothetical protein MHU86_23834 [Fragilaria crotonensis]|nr:hypothetical protein MHU86_23834 [Fragilaria crotonensis]